MTKDSTALKEQLLESAFSTGPTKHGAGMDNDVELVLALKRRLKRTSHAFTSLLAKHQGLAQHYRTQKHCLDRAARIQQSLLPVRPPSFRGYRFAHLYRPSEVLGGDFFDFFETGKCLVIVVCDVIGHGVEAALATMLMKEVFEESVEVTREPVQLLATMNARLHRFLPEGMFVAAAIVKMCLRCPDVQFSNAGLPYPFVLRNAQDCVEQVEIGGFPLGLFKDVAVPYQVRTVSLAPGDVLLVGSDGIRTVAGTTGEFFEDERLPRLLSELVGRNGEEVVQKIAAEVQAFGNGHALPDDLNLLAITREYDPESRGLESLHAGETASRASPADDELVGASEPGERPERLGTAIDLP